MKTIKVVDINTNTQTTIEDTKPEDVNPEEKQQEDVIPEVIPQGEQPIVKKKRVAKPKKEAQPEAQPEAQTQDNETVAIPEVVVVKKKRDRKKKLEPIEEAQEPVPEPAKAPEPDPVKAPEPEPVKEQEPEPVKEQEPEPIVEEKKKIRTQQLIECPDCKKMLTTRTLKYSHQQVCPAKNPPEPKQKKNKTDVVKEDVAESSNRNPRIRSGRSEKYKHLVANAF